RSFGSGGYGSGLVRRDISRRLLRTAREEILLHLGGEECAGFGVERIQAVLVDQHGLVREPFAPGLLRYVFVDAPTEFAGPRRETEALGFAVELHAMHHARHRVFSTESSSTLSSSLRTGAGRPSEASCPGSNH